MTTLTFHCARKIAAFGLLAGMLAGCAVYAPPPRPAAYYYGPAYYAPAPAIYGHVWIR